MRRTLLALVIVTLAACTSSAKPGETSKGLTAKGSKDPVAQVKITTCAVDPILDLLTVKGTAENTTSKRSDFFIELSITDKSGKTQLGTTNAIAQNVEPGQTAQWDAPSTVQNPPAGAVCKVAEVQRTASV